ncbi:hypothetical protein VTN02DRAFT_3870 [Thermoascus thermophilus]
MDHDEIANVSQGRSVPDAICPVFVHPTDMRRPLAPWEEPYALGLFLSPEAGVIASLETRMVLCGAHHQQPSRFSWRARPRRGPSPGQSSTASV